MEDGGWGGGEEVGDWVAGETDFDGEGGGALEEADGGEDQGGVPDGGGVEDVPVEEEDGGEGEGEDGEVEDAVDVD